MKSRFNRKLAATTALSTALALGLSLGTTQAMATGNETAGQNVNARADVEATGSITSADDADAAMEAQGLIDESVSVVGQMKADEGFQEVLQRAKGIYIVPDYGKGAAIVGGEGGAGVVLVKQNAEWTDPAFYNFGGVSLGAQAGGEAGSMAFLLMTDDAVNAFKSGNKVTLDADAGFTLVNWSADAEASWGKADVVTWSDTEGLFGGASLGVTDINWDDDSNEVVYGAGTDMSAVLAGKVENDNAEKLKNALES
ncbi:lipid-binding SYLF domain-containing protein [Parvibaculum sp.]|uniref:lipid-binding SYLF domain-containing protein n=1 Tax=Parvibaculum sp. TaxID=2024848 RepID=UPI003BAAC169